MIKQQKYESLDGLRSIAAISIVMMHVLVNVDYDLSGGAFIVIAKLGNFVPLFFIISAFGMCCGYYERIKNNEISLNNFYWGALQKDPSFFFVACAHRFAFCMERNW